MKNNRRNFVKKLSALSFIPALNLKNSWSGVEGSPNITQVINLPQIGKIQRKTPHDFSESPFGIGCETLDRDLWQPKEIYPWMDNLPVKWARLQTGWARVEREKGTYDWAWLDESVDGLLQRGFKPFFNVGYGNPNYTEGDTGYYPMINVEAYAAWKKFVEALTKRYKAKIQYYEIWNEPNLRGFWKPGDPDPAKYYGLVKDTAQIIRKNCRNAVIIGGVLSRLPFNYIKSLFENGIGKEIDIFSFHPYGDIPEDYVEMIKALRMLIDQYNPEIKIWQAECGYPSAPNSSGFTGEGPWTETIQAKIMLRRLLTDVSLGVDMTLWFLIVDIHDYPKGTGRVNYKGILRVKPVVEPKLAFSALQNLGSLINGDISVRNSMVYLAESITNVTADAEYARYGTREIKTLDNIYSAFLNSSQCKILAFWAKVKAADSYESKEIDLFIWDWEGKAFQEPVLVDPLSGSIYDLSKKYSSSDPNAAPGKDVQIIKQLPLQDYPMLIMERNIVLA